MLRTALAGRRRSDDPGNRLSPLIGKVPGNFTFPLAGEVGPKARVGGAPANHLPARRGGRAEGPGGGARQITSPLAGEVGPKARVGGPGKSPPRSPGRSGRRPGWGARQITSPLAGEVGPKARVGGPTPALPLNDVLLFDQGAFGESG